MSMISEEWLDATMRYLKGAIQSNSTDEKRHGMHLAKMLHDVLADQVATLSASVLPPSGIGVGAAAGEGEDLRAAILKMLMQRMTSVMMGPQPGSFRAYGY
jgi:hypothetical protein